MTRLHSESRWLRGSARARLLLDVPAPRRRRRSWRISPCAPGQPHRRDKLAASAVGSDARRAGAHEPPASPLRPPEESRRRRRSPSEPREKRCRSIPPRWSSMSRRSPGSPARRRRKRWSRRRFCIVATSWRDSGRRGAVRGVADGGAGAPARSRDRRPARGARPSTQTGALAAALRTARQLLAIDRCRSRCTARSCGCTRRLGQRAAALRQYQQCVAVLQRELGVEPELETKQLYQEILRQRAPPADRPLAAPRERTARSARAGGARPPARRDSAGRSRRCPWRSSTRRSVRPRRDRGQMVAILGEAGIGKSRLVEELIAPRGTTGSIILGRAYESDQIRPSAVVDAFRADERPWTRRR